MNGLFTGEEMNPEGIDALINSSAAQGVSIQRLTNEELEQMPAEVPRPRGPGDVRRTLGWTLTSCAVLLDDQHGWRDLLSRCVVWRALSHLRRASASCGGLRRLVAKVAIVFVSDY